MTLLIISSLMCLPLLAKPKAETAPKGTTITADYRLGKPAENLIDGDPTTQISGAPGTAKKPVSLFIKFPKPLPKLAGVELGASDPRGNYFPIDIEFWADTTGDNKYDTLCGTITGIKSPKKVAGKRIFQNSVKNVHSLMMRVTKQSQKGLNRAFIMKELSFIYDAPGAVPNMGGKALSAAPLPKMKKPSKPMNVTMGKPQLLVTPAKKTWRAVNGKKKKQDAILKESAGKTILELQWKAKGKNLMELACKTRPYVKAFNKGVAIEIDINTDGIPGLKGWGVRCKDANKETWQFGGAKIPAGAGWKKARMKLNPNGGKTHSYGGPEDSRGRIDLPLKFSALLFNAPGKGIKQDQSIQLGNVYRNEFSQADVETEIELMPITSRIATAYPFPMCTTEKPQAALSLSLPEGEKEKKVNVEIRFTDYFGNKSTFNKKDVLLQPGKSTEVDFHSVLKGLGWWEVLPAITTADGKARRDLKGTQMIKINPAGPRKGPRTKGDDFLYGMDIRIKNPEKIWQLDLAKMLGVDIVRHTRNWVKIEPERGAPLNLKFHDELIKEINKRGMITQYHFGFTPPWAVDQEVLKTVAQKDRKHSSRYHPNLADWKSYIDRMTKHMNDAKLNIDYFEIWNEADLYGFYKGTTDTYLQLLSSAYDCIKKNRPNAHVMTCGIATMGPHGGHNKNPDLIKRTILEGKYDILNLHEHGPFSSFIGKIDGSLERVLKKKKNRPRFYFNECGTSTTPLLDRTEQAQQVVKKYAAAINRGGIALNWFVLRAQSKIPGYSMINAKNDAPWPVVASYSTMVNQLRGKPPKKQIQVTPGYWIFPFANEKESTLVGWEEDPFSSGIQVPVTIPNGSQAQIVDVMGNPRGTVKGTYIWQLGKKLQYLDVKGGKPTVGKPLVCFKHEPFGEPNKKLDINAHINNPNQQEETVKLTWTTPTGKQIKQTLNLKPGESTVAIQPITMPVQEGNTAPELQLSYSFEKIGTKGKLNLPLHAAQLIPNTPIASRKPDLEAGTRDKVFNKNKNDPNRAQFLWKGPQDVSSKVWLHLEKDALVITAKVMDDKHMQPNDAASSWKADGIQFAFAIPGYKGRWEIGAAKNDSGQKMIACFRTPQGFEKDYENTISYNIEPMPGGLKYTIRLPYEGFGMTQEDLRTKAVSFNLIANDEDGGGREGFAYLAEGLGRGPLNIKKWPLLIFQ